MVALVRSRPMTNVTIPASLATVAVAAMQDAASLAQTLEANLRHELTSIVEQEGRTAFDITDEIEKATRARSRYERAASDMTIAINARSTTL